jgi:hypothetical protein
MHRSRQHGCSDASRDSERLVHRKDYVKRYVTFAAVALALAFVPTAVAKEFTSLVLVGPGGRSTELRPTAILIDQLFAGERAEARGGYMRVYPLSRTGHVGIPGRFYPETGAVCLSWDQSAPPRNCHRPREPLARLLSAPTITLFSGPGVTLRTLESPSVRRPVVSQLRVAFELAFDRFRLARRAAPTPRRCLAFAGTWRGIGANKRPRAFCLAPDGIHARGLLYPLGREPWHLSFLNQRTG